MHHLQTYMFNKWSVPSYVAHASRKPVQIVMQKHVSLKSCRLCLGWGCHDRKGFACIRVWQLSTMRLYSCDRSNTTSVMACSIPADSKCLLRELVRKA